jgi:hypothetical protein
MLTRNKLLEQLRERKTNQSKIVYKRPNDRIAYEHLRTVTEHIEQMEKSHTNKSDKYLLFRNIDFRSQGDDHSAVHKTPTFRCCEVCVQAMLFWLKENNSGYMKLDGLYYSMGEDKGEKLNKRIVVYPARSIAQSMDSDEMRINNEWLS